MRNSKLLFVRIKNRHPSSHLVVLNKILNLVRNRSRHMPCRHTIERQWERAGNFCSQVCFVELDAACWLGCNRRVPTGWGCRWNIARIWRQRFRFFDNIRLLLANPEKKFFFDFLAFFYSPNTFFPDFWPTHTIFWYHFAKIRKKRIWAVKNPQKMEKRKKFRIS